MIGNRLSLLGSPETARFSAVLYASVSAAEGRAMSETRKLAAILCSDGVGYSRLAGADEDRILARLRALRSPLIDPTIAVHQGRVVMHWRRQRRRVSQRRRRCALRYRSSERPGR